MKFDVFTLFPEFFAGPLTSSILKRGQASGTLQIGVHDIRNWAEGKHRVCDDYPFGGGAGMVMKAEPVAAAIESVLNFNAGPHENDEGRVPSGQVMKDESSFSSFIPHPSSFQPPCPVILMTPQGRPFSQAIARELSQKSHLALLCGHYEGIDERAVDLLVTDEISIGDYVLTGGEAAALVIIEAVARLVPGVLGNEASPLEESFSEGLLEAPCYTRPAVWRGQNVPEVLLSGHHGETANWKRREALRRTLQRRPDLAEGLRESRVWTKEEEKIWDEFAQKQKSNGASGLNSKE
ncbi:MAG TPA: tRNA (guanosine(37)-N1)-methyltransferase TrmD [Abditibacteriaceae bacterium]